MGRAICCFANIFVETGIHNNFECLFHSMNQNRVKARSVSGTSLVCVVVKTNQMRDQTKAMALRFSIECHRKTKAKVVILAKITSYANTTTNQGSKQIHVESAKCGQKRVRASQVSF